MVITVVQLQVFHKKYLERIEIPNLSTYKESVAPGIQPSSSVNYVSLEPDSTLEEQPKARDHSRMSISELTTEKVRMNDNNRMRPKKNGIITLFQAIKKVTLIYNRTKWFFDIFWLFIELHFIKVIMILAFLLGINEVCLIPRNNSICNSNPLCLADFSHSYQCDFAECNCCNGTNKHSNSLQWIHFAHHRFSTHIANGLSDKIHTTERL